jgi:hypothetical protein
MCLQAHSCENDLPRHALDPQFSDTFTALEVHPGLQFAKGLAAVRSNINFRIKYLECAHTRLRQQPLNRGLECPCSTSVSAMTSLSSAVRS